MQRESMSFDKAGKALILGIVFTVSLLGNIPLGEESTGIETIQSNPGEVVFRYHIGALETFEVETRAGTFSQIQIPGYHYTDHCRAQAPGNEPVDTDSAGSGLGNRYSG